MKSIYYLSLILLVMVMPYIAQSQVFLLDKVEYKLKENGTTIVQYENKEILTFDYITGITPPPNYVYEVRLLPLSHEDSDGYLTVNCSEGEIKRNTNQLSVVKVSNIQVPQQTQQQVVKNSPVFEDCYPPFKLDISELVCVNRIVIKIYSTIVGEAMKEYIIELRPLDVCDN